MHLPEGFDATSDSDNVVSQFTLGRLAQTMDRHNYEYSYNSEEGWIRAAWGEARITFSLSDDGFWWRSVSHWRCPDWLQDSSADTQWALLKQAANEWNRNYLEPPAYPVQTGAEWTLELYQSVFIGAGLSDQQASLQLRRTIANQVQAHKTVPSLLPPA